MKYCLLLFFLVVSTISNAQEKLNKLQATSSPAANILGIQPSVILAPKSYQALETALYSNFTDGNSGVIPNDFALEFTPYWTKDHSLSLDDYLYPSKISEQVIRNSSFSIASTQNFLLGDSTSTNGLGFGYRTTLFFGNKKDRKILEDYKQQSETIKKINVIINSEAEVIFGRNNILTQDDFLQAIEPTLIETINTYLPSEDINTKKEIIEEIMNKASMLSLDVNDYDEFLNSFFNIVDLRLKGPILFNEFKKYIRARQGWSVDIAYANLVNFPTNNFEFSYLPRQSFWLSPTYSFKDQMNFLKVSGVIRYEWYDLDYFRNYFANSKVFENNFDYGLAISSNFEKVSLNFELVGRRSETEIPAGQDNEGNNLFRRDKSSDLQYLFSFNYNLADQVILSYSIGNRFEPISNPSNTLVSLISLNFGFGAPLKNSIDLNK